METFIAIAAIVLGIVGIIGSVAPALPGPPLSWLGLLLLYFWGGGTNGAGEPMSTTFLLVWLAIVGLIIGLIYPPVGMILGSLLGAFAAELLFAGKNTVTSLKSAFGAFLGFLFGTGLKLICCGVMMFYIIVYAF